MVCQSHAVQQSSMHLVSGAIAGPPRIQQREPQALAMLSHGNLSTCTELVSRAREKVHWENKKSCTSSLVCDHTKMTVIPNLNSWTVDGWAYGSTDIIREFAQEPNIKYYHDITDCGNFKMEDWMTLCNKAVEAGCVITADDVTYNKASDKQEGKEADEATDEQEDGLHISAFTSLLQRCIKKRDLAEGRQVHRLIVMSGLEYDTFLGGHLIRMFSFFERLSETKQIFSKLFKPNVFSWSAIISAHGESGQNEEAVNLYQEMRGSTVEPDGHVFVATLKACSTSAALEQGRTIHGHIIESGLETDVYVGSTVIDMYSNCGSVADAQAVFDRLPRRNVVTWSALIKGYSQQDHGEEALQLFQQMQQQGMDPDQVTFVCILKACSSVTLKQAQQIHAHIIGRGFESDVWIRNSLVDLYARCETVAAARIMFYRLPEQDVVACSALIAGYTQHNHGHQALQVYEQMQHDCIEPDLVIFVCILKACTSIAALEYGQQVHAHIIDSGFEANIAVGSTLIDLYAKCRSLTDAKAVFLRLPIRNIVTWNALITGYSQQEYSEEVLQLFDQLQEEGMNPDPVTFGSVLKACSSTEHGKQIHDYIVQSGLELDSFVSNALVDMYAKCGRFADAHMIFDRLPNRDVVSWSSLIGGYIQHDHVHKALQLFGQMQQEGWKPNNVTFICILSACSHAGLINEGCLFFNSMVEEYKLTPETDHYSCMIDLLGKAGRLAEAAFMISKLLAQPNAPVWRTFLAACRTHGDVKQAEWAAEHLLDAGPQDRAIYTLLSNIYAANGRWIDVERVGKAMGKSVRLREAMVAS